MLWKKFANCKQIEPSTLLKGYYALTRFLNWSIRLTWLWAARQSVLACLLCTLSIENCPWESRSRRTWTSTASLWWTGRRSPSQRWLKGCHRSPSCSRRRRLPSCRRWPHRSCLSLRPRGRGHSARCPWKWLGTLEIAFRCHLARGRCRATRNRCLKCGSWW